MSMKKNLKKVSNIYDTSTWPIDEIYFRKIQNICFEKDKYRETLWMYDWYNKKQKKNNNFIKHSFYCTTSKILRLMKTCNNLFFLICIPKYISLKVRDILYYCPALDLWVTLVLKAWSRSLKDNFRKFPIPLRTITTAEFFSHFSFPFPSFLFLQPLTTLFSASLDINIGSAFTKNMSNNSIGHCNSVL